MRHSVTFFIFVHLPYKLLFCLLIQWWFSQLPTLPCHPETWKSICHLSASKNLSSDMISTAQSFPGICTDLETQDRPAHSSTAALDVDTPTDSATGDLSSPPATWSPPVSPQWVQGHYFHMAALLHFKPKTSFYREQEEHNQVFSCYKVLLNSTTFHQLAQAKKSSSKPKGTITMKQHMRPFQAQASKSCVCNLNWSESFFQHSQSSSMLQDT